MYLKFWVNTIFHRILPGGYGYHRYLRQFKDPNYIFERDKHEIRKKHIGGEGWNLQDNDGILYRNYTDYNEYLLHQSQKYNEILKISGGLSNHDIFSYRLKFYRRFIHLHRILKPSARILCAGARQGTEVEVLKDMGFINARGIDLNPGPNNPFVDEGDFLNISLPDNAIDFLYSNAVDHAYDLKTFFQEHKRVVQPDGYALYDIPLKSGGPFEAVEWKDEKYIISLLLENFSAIIMIITENDWKWILVKR